MSSTEIKSILVGGSKETVVSKVEKEGYHLTREFRHQGIILRHATVVGDDNRDLKIEDGNVKGRLHVRVESGSRTASFRAGKIN